jgi:predicted ATPase
MVRASQRTIDDMPLLERVIPRFEVAPDAPYPFCLDLWRSADGIEFPAEATLLTGDNGSGKSTLLETIAAALRLPALAQREVADHPLMTATRAAAKRVRLVKRGPIRRGFFFRADDVTGFLQSQARRAAELNALGDEYAARFSGEARRRAEGMARAQAAALTDRYGENPFARSHGELFLALFDARITAPGLYLMDEPEAPLSPSNQITLLALIRRAIADGSQFIIATHSPILMALPGAALLDFNARPPAPIDWQDTEHVSITRAFLTNPQSFLRHLEDDD